MANGHGGRRPGAGRKKKAITIIKDKAIEEAGEDAKYALGLFVSVMRNDELPLDLRMDAALVVQDRVWGKATQKQDIETHDLRVILDQ